MRILPPLFACLSLVGAACSQAPGEDPNAIKVAVALPMTGTFADNGERHRAAIQMAFRDLEAAGGVHGRTVRAVLIDCGDQMATANDRLVSTLGPADAPTQAVRAFISSSTACHEATLPYALQLKVPHLEVSSGSADDEVLSYATSIANLDLSYEFQVRALCHNEAEMTPEFLSMSTDMRRVAILRGSHPHDLMHTSVVRAQMPLSAFEANGGQVLNADDIVMPNDGPYSEGLQKALALNPDTLYFHLNGDTRNLNFLAELKRSGFAGKIVTCGMVRKPIVLDPVSPGLIDYLGGKLFFMMRGPVGGPTLDAFKADYKTFYGKDADTFAASAYDAAMLVGLAAAAAAGETGADLRDAVLKVASDGTPVSYGDVGNALQLINSGTDINYEGASGTLDFRADHSVPSKYYVDQVKYDAPTNTGSYGTLSSPIILR